MKKIIFIFMLLPAIYRASAQTTPPAPATSPASPFIHEQAISLTTGTIGIGAEYRYGLTTALNVRAGFSILPVDANVDYTANGFKSKAAASAKFSGFHLLADVTPFKSFSLLRVVAGAAYFTNANGHVKMTPKDSYKYGDIALNADQVGYLDTDVNWKGFSPYIGLGFIHAFPKKKFNVNLDLGAYYIGEPTAVIVGTGILTGNENQTATVQRNISDYKWFPNAQLSFSFKL